MTSSPDPKGATAKRRKAHQHGWRCEDTLCPHCGCCHIKGKPGCECDVECCQCLLATLTQHIATTKTCPTCHGEGVVPERKAVAP